MKILNYGSLNFDFVYNVPHFVNAGETLASTERQIFPGGKGLNQSVALARAGANIYHAGAVGDDGMQLIELLKQSGADTSFVHIRHGISTGHAVIQVDKSGQNCILLYGGANVSQTEDEIDQVISSFSAGDILLLQNEINEIDLLIQKAHAHNMIIALNPSPITESLFNTSLDFVDIFILNEVEAKSFCDEEETDNQLLALKNLYPNAEIILTLGEKGVICVTADGQRHEHGAFKVSAIDTTAAGDTFTGFYLASIAKNKPVNEALKLASAASAIAVSRRGASASIPTIKEVEMFL